MSLRHRPILGGIFGRDGRYAVATLPVVTRGLHAVRHLVIEPTAGRTALEFVTVPTRLPRLP